MAETWETERFQRKLKGLPPDIQESFRKMVKDIHKKESDTMVSFISESRKDMNKTASVIKREQDALRATPLQSVSARDRYTPMDSRQTALSKAGVSPDKLQRYLQRKMAEKEMRSTSRFTTASCMSSLSTTSLSLSETDSPESRPSTSRSCRLQTPDAPPRQVGRSARSPSPVPGRWRDRPGPLIQQDSALTGEALTPGILQEPKVSYEAETEAIMQAAAEQSSKAEMERTRQLEKVKRAKERKKARQRQQAELATKLIDLANEVAETHAKDKKRQEQKIRERLEEMKRRKEEEDAMTSSS